MSKRSFHTELRQYICLLTGNNAPVHDDAWDNLMEEVDNAYAAFLRDKDSNGIHFSNVLSEVVALDLDVEIAGIPDHIEKSDDLKCMATEVEDKIRHW